MVKNIKIERLREGKPLKMEGEFKEKINCVQTFPQLSEN